MPDYATLTPAEFKEARQTLGLDALQAADMLRFAATSDQARRNAISRVETGRAPLSPERTELLRAYLAGYRPADWPG